MSAHQDRSTAAEAASFPQIFRVRQKFEAPTVDDLTGQVEARLQRLNLGRVIAPGQTVAIAAGSRGIHRIGEIIRTIVDHLKGLGAAPFIVPAMGSHGGGTAAGQQPEVPQGSSRAPGEASHRDRPFWTLQVRTP